MPDKTFPGPISMNFVIFSLDILIILSLHLTVAQICSINSLFILSGSSSGVDVTLLTILKFGFLKLVAFILSFYLLLVSLVNNEMERLHLME